MEGPWVHQKMQENSLKGGYSEIFAREFRDDKCNDQSFKIMVDIYEEKAKVIIEYL